MKTFKFRIKGNTKHLDNMSRAVNFVWNFANQTSIEYLDKRGKWLSGFDLDYLIAGCSKDLPINYDIMSAVVHRYAELRIQTKKPKLSWRSGKRSLGWVPFKRPINVEDDCFKFNKFVFRFWKSREIEGKIKCGSFAQDSKGNWFINFVCDNGKKSVIKSGGSVGIDLGLKTLATLSNGDRLSRQNITTKYAQKLATAQRARKKKQVKSIHTKIKNVRKDWNHKQTTKLINRFDKIVVGNVSSSKLKKTRFAKSVSDAGWADFKSMLAYKAVALGVGYKEVKENYSTVTCSHCGSRSGPKGLAGLNVRDWICLNCGTTHDRDVNAAINILFSDSGMNRLMEFERKVPKTGKIDLTA